ncbi:MAG: 30S ribosomal protein S12 methylthiotransferase RimO [Bacteroidales bacterium]|nr:30S ribosomal protein S12 methylthiotransferase RimO [Bacteroidales bacterium]
MKNYKKTISIITLGCSKNTVDSEDLATRLTNNYNVVYGEYGNADIVIINTCGFILDAKQESIDTILEYAKMKQEGEIEKLFVFGCLSQRYKKELIDEIPEVDEFFGVNSLEDILNCLECSTASNNEKVRNISTPKHYAYIKIAEGCNRMCAFCAIPYIRGRYISRKIEDIVKEVELLAKNGTHEFNIIAQDLSYYGKDIYGDYKLPELVEKLEKIENVKWIRLHYTYPNNFPLETLKLMKNSKKICHYLDIPLQHINDRVLSKMKRGHTKEETLNLLKKFREEIPDIALRTSIMVGFPGETDLAFNELVDFVKETRFDRLGVFTYSAEEGTFSAENYADRISQKKKQERADKIMSIQQKISLELNVAKIGKQYEIIIDREEGEFFVGRTKQDSPEVDNEVLVKKIDAKDFKIGKFYNVEIIDAEEFDLYAKPIHKNEQNE